MRQIILLGASNLTYGFPLLVESLHASLPAPVSVFAAHGHGRSYGQWSRVLGRGLPGIRHCGLWEALTRQPTPSARPLALITDVGNDLLYGADPQSILSWIAYCVQRLQAVDAQLTITGLPLTSVQRMSAPRYHATRMLFFPGTGPTWPAMRRMVEELDAGLSTLAVQFQATLIVPRRQWYGLDPIHVRRAHRIQAWQEILAAWTDLPPPPMQKPTFGRTVQIWRLKPAERTMYGLRQLTPQPSVRGEDGSTIWLY